MLLLKCVWRHLGASGYHFQGAAGGGKRAAVALFTQDCFCLSQGPACVWKKGQGRSWAAPLNQHGDSLTGMKSRMCFQFLLHCNLNVEQGVVWKCQPVLLRCLQTQHTFWVTEQGLCYSPVSSMVLPKRLFNPQTHRAITACPVCRLKAGTIVQPCGYSKSIVCFPDIFSRNVYIFMTTLLTN